MSDLQCPATFHVFGPAVSADRAPVGGAVAAAVYAADGRRDLTDAGSGHLDETRPLWDVLTELADTSRGTHVVVLTSRVVPPLAGADDYVVVRIDADGRSVERP